MVRARFEIVKMYKSDDRRHFETEFERRDRM